MNPSLIQKIRLLYLPYLIIAVLLCGVYTFFNWLFIIRWQLFSVKDVVVDFGIPLVLPVIPILWYFRPRIKLLRLQAKKGSWSDFYLLILWISLAVPIIVAQHYIEKATGQLTQLDNINQMASHKPTKYYTLKNAYFDRTHMGVHPSFDISGKNSDDFNMHIYLTIPILEKEADSSATSCSGWLGIEYSKTIRNNLDPDEKEKIYQQFAQESQQDFDNKDLGKFVYLDKVGNTEDGDGFKAAVKKAPLSPTTDAPVFLPVNEPFEKRTGNSLAWIFGTFGIGAIAWLVMILIPPINEEKIQQFKTGKAGPDNEIKELLDFLKPQEGFFITLILIYINIAVYLAMVFKGLGFITFKGQDLLNWGANYRPSTTAGDWWRLLTSTFLHGGIMHLLFNMYGLLFVGMFLEPLLGRARFLIFYLLTGILASCASLYWHANTVSVGASGAIFGLYGLFLAFMFTRIFSSEFSKIFLVSSLVFVGFNLLMGLTGNIDNAAHIGGLVSGLGIGFVYSNVLKSEGVKEELFSPEQDDYPG